MALPFNPNTPQGSQTIASTQNPILQNFQSIDSAFNSGGLLNFTKYAIQNVNSVAAPVDPVGVFHTLLGANFFANKPLPFFINSVGDFPLLPDLKTGAGPGLNLGFKYGNIIINYGIVNLLLPANTFPFAVPFTNTNAFVGITPSSASQLATSGPISYSITVGSVTFRPSTAMVLPLTCSYIALGT